ncbi:hypothetical protein GGG16DRAFT_119745 [Schizophyllum commune]
MEIVQSREEDLLSFEELNGMAAGVSGPSKRRDEGVYEVSVRLYLLPRPVNIFTRRFHVASSAPLDHFLEIHAPLSLKQRIAVRRARVPLALNVSLLCPSPHMRPPSLYRVASHPLRQRIAVRRARFATLFELAAPPATPSILVSNNFNTPRGLGADAHPSNVADVKGISSALPRAPFSMPRGR